MNAAKSELAASIRQNRELLETIRSSIDDALDQEIAQLGKTARSALIIAGLLENYYTCAESIFLRISQYFENSLDSERWHADLLQKMTLDIEGVRPRAVAPQDEPALRELLRFRHFKRNYFDLDYDWDSARRRRVWSRSPWPRIDFLVKKVRQVHPGLERSLDRFDGFLRDLG